jgi:hypothetical protein
MKKFLSILLATVMVVSLVPALFVGAADTVNKASAITADKNGRVYHYYETFDDVTATQGADKVLSLLGWGLPTDSKKQEAHDANLAATESVVDGTYMYEIKDGKLYLRNRGSENEYAMIIGSEELAEVFTGAFVIEYTQTYLASSTDTNDGYVSLLYNANAAASVYAESVLRISGWGNNRTYAFALDAGDVSTSVDRECALTDYNVHNDLNYTLYERLFGNLDAAPGTTNGKSLEGSKVMVDKELRVRLEFDGVVGPRVFVNDLLVSDPRDISNADTRFMAQTGYNDYLTFGGSYLALCVTPGIDCVLDEITVYETSVASTPSLYITEIATLPANPAAPYVEIYNGGDATVSLADYVGGYIVVDEKGNERVVTVPFADYIGQTFTMGEVEINGLSESAAELAAGETVLVFPVDATAPMTVAEFREEYGLSSSQKVLPISGAAFEVDHTEYRHWFVADYLTEGGRPYNWKQYSVKDMAVNEAVESIVELVPSIAFGYGDDVSESSLTMTTDPLSYHFGRGGDPQPGYSAHYIYGANFSTGARTGLMISRCTELIADAKNVGALLDVQNTYFARIADFREGLFDNRGGLAITEFIPVTAENDAYECFEVTNISATALDLYSFGLVSSGNAAYGAKQWTRATLLEARPGSGINNPSNKGVYMVEPGKSVVIWNKSAAAEGKTVEDFREYHGLGRSVVVVVALCTDVEKNVVAENAGTVSYGIAARSDILRFQQGTYPVVNKVVTDVLVPLHSIHYAVDGLYSYNWNDIAMLGNMDILSAMVVSQFNGCEMTGHILPAGASLAGYFTREQDENGNEIFVKCGADEVVAENNTTEYFAPKDLANFYAYGSKQMLDFPADYAVSFSYGSSVYASKGSGSLVRALEVETYNYDMAGRGYGMLPYLVDVANRFITTDIKSGGTTAHTLGSVEAHQGVDVSITTPGYYTVTYLDSSATAVSSVILNGNACSDVYTVLTDEYDTWLVNNVKYNAGETVMITGNTVIKPALLGTSSDVDLPGNNGGAESAPSTNGSGDASLNLDNLDPNSINEQDAKALTVLWVALIAVAGCAVIATGVVFAIKLSKKKSV